MAKLRIIETNEGIQDELTVEIFDHFARIMRDKGWNNVDCFKRQQGFGGWNRFRLPDGDSCENVGGSLYGGEN